MGEGVRGGGGRGRGGGGKAWRREGGGRGGGGGRWDPARPFTARNRGQCCVQVGNPSLPVCGRLPAHRNTCFICSQTGEAGFQNCRFEPGTFRKVLYFTLWLHRTSADRASGVHAGSPISVMRCDIVFLLLKKLNIFALQCQYWFLLRDEDDSGRTHACSPPSLWSLPLPPVPPPQSPQHLAEVPVPAAHQLSVPKTGVCEYDLPGSPSLLTPCAHKPVLHIALYSAPQIGPFAPLPRIPHAIILNNLTPILNDMSLEVLWVLVHEESDAKTVC